MTIGSIIMLVIAAVCGMFGFFGGHAAGKSSGRKEGAEQAKAEITSTQNQAAAKSAQERTHVEVAVAADSDDDLERRLSKHNRPG